MEWMYWQWLSWLSWSLLQLELWLSAWQGPDFCRRLRQIARRMRKVQRLEKRQRPVNLRKTDNYSSLVLQPWHFSWVKMACFWSCWRNLKLSVTSAIFKAALVEFYKIFLCDDDALRWNSWTYSEWDNLAVSHWAVSSQELLEMCGWWGQGEGQNCWGIEWSHEVEYKQKKMETNVNSFLMVATGLWDDLKLGCEMTSSTTPRRQLPSKRLLTCSEQVRPWVGGSLSFLICIPKLAFSCCCSSSQLRHSFVPSRTVSSACSKEQQVVLTCSKRQLGSS